VILNVLGIRDRHPHIPATLVPRNVGISGGCGGLNLPRPLRTWVPGLPIQDDAGGHNNCLPSRFKMSAILVTAKAMFERLYDLVPGLVPICALCHHALGAHTPTAHAPAISQFPCNFFPEWSLNYDVNMIHQVIWPSARVPGLSQITWRIVLTKKMRDQDFRAIGNQEIVAERASGTWALRA